MIMKKKNNKFKIVITGGGTGGHIYPALAVAQTLKNDNDVEKIYYIGCNRNMESKIIPKEGFEFYSISISGMPRKHFVGLFKWTIELLHSTIQSLAHLIKLKPDVVFGTGGYVSGPVLIAASLLKIPFIIHDSDAHPGIVSRAMSPFAKAVSVSFESAKKYMKSNNTIVNGNPIRSNLNKIDKEEACNKLNLSSNKKTIFVMGGSQGAKSINNAIAEIIKNLITNENFQVIHQTGAKNFDSFKETLAQQWPEYIDSQDYIVQPFFECMELPYAASDLAICRAGSLSLSELNLVGLPSILIPYPYAAADHQRYNAKAMEKANASLYLDDTECNGTNLLNKIHEAFECDNITKMKNENLKLAKPDATCNIIKIIKESM